MRPRRSRCVRALHPLARTRISCSLAGTQAPIALGILPPPDSRRARRTLILDLDETLIHSSFVPIPKYDLLVPITMAHRSRYGVVAHRPSS